MLLGPAQCAALAFVEERAQASLAGARRSLDHSLRGVCEGAERDRLLADIRARARLTLSFHPDRLGASGASVVRGLFEDGVYRSQFETGLSNGSLTAFPGGARDAWERALFGDAYHAPASPPEARPKYGGLDLWGHADGACPRFGSCYFVLRPEALARATLTWGDSHLGPAHVGTFGTLEIVLAPLFETLIASGEVLGRTGLSLRALLAAWNGGRAETLASPASAELGRALDAYIEAQIHGPITLGRDVAALVIDPSFDGTETGAELGALAQRYAIPLTRRAPLTLSVAAWSVPDAFRGAAMRDLAERIVDRFGDGTTLDAATIGRSAVSRVRVPERAAWADWPADEAETLQQLKQLWHVLVAFGTAG